MLELSPEEVEAYLQFFPRFEEAVQMGWAACNPRASKPLSALQIIDTLGPTSKREYERARSGEIWFNIGAFGHAKRRLGFANLDLELQAGIEAAAAAHHRISQLFKYRRTRSWGTASFSKAIKKSRADSLFGHQDRKNLFAEQELFSKFTSSIINKTASSGDQGAAINNAYVLSEYMHEERGNFLSFLPPSDFADRLLRVTRAGGWVSQSVGQWYRFAYFKGRTEQLVAEKHAQAGIIQFEHARHWERRNRLINNALEFGSASKALSLAIEQYGATSDLIDPILYLNAADEFLERGYPAGAYPLGLSGMSLKKILKEAEARLDLPNSSASTKISHLTLSASLLMNDGDYDGAEFKLYKAGMQLLPDQNGGDGQLHRGLRLVQGKIALLKGQINNEYLDRSREICLTMGAFHKVWEIDRLQQTGDIERPS